MVERPTDLLVMMQAFPTKNVCPLAPSPCVASLPSHPLSPSSSPLPFLFLLDLAFLSRRRRGLGASPARPPALCLQWLILNGSPVGRPAAAGRPFGRCHAVAPRSTAHSVGRRRRRRHCQRTVFGATEDGWRWTMRRSMFGNGWNSEVEVFIRLPQRIGDGEVR